MKSIYMDDRWGKLQEVKEGGIACRYIYEGQGVRVVYPFIKRIAGTVNCVDYYDVVTPRGVSGIWFENSDPGRNGDGELNQAVEGFREGFQVFCNEENIVAEFVRFSPWSDDFKMFFDVYRMREYGANYCNSLTRDFFHEEYSSRKQSKIRKMKREGVEITFGSDGAYISNFIRLYANTQAKYDVTDYHRVDEAFVLKYLEVFPGEAFFAQAHFDGNVIVSSLILFGRDVAHFHFGGSDPDFHYLDANSLLLYEAALYSAREGKKLFDLGDALRGGSLERFKQSTAKGYPYFVGTKVQNEKIYNELVEMAGGPRENYFPEYRR